MHRIVEYFDDANGAGLTVIPPERHPHEPWQSIVMARTTIADEDIAMEPRMGTSLAARTHRSLSFGRRDNPLGRGFLWTMAKPLAEFEASDRAIDCESGKGQVPGDREPGQSQIKAALASNPAGFLEALSTK